MRQVTISKSGTFSPVNMLIPSRNGVWLTIGNLGLQLIQGSPAVHPDDDLIVGHIAIEVESENMAEIRQGLQRLGWQSRKNISVPNPDKANTPVDQVL